MGLFEQIGAALNPYPENKIETEMKTDNSIKEKRTQGKWEVWEDYQNINEPCFSVRGERGNYVICKTVANQNEPPASQTAKANAELIVKSVNGYAGLEELNGVLVEALKDILKFDKERDLVGWLKDFDNGEGEELKTILEKAKAALSKAESRI